MGKLFRVFGLLFFLMGITVIFNSFQGITGYVVYGDVDLDAGFIIGAWFIFTSILLAVFRGKTEKTKDKKS
jgi:hypothetical protein